MAQEVQELNRDVIVECYLDAKYYHYDPVELNDLADFNADFANLVEGVHIVTADNATVDEDHACASVNDSFKDLENAFPSWEPNTEVINPKWSEHHQSGHLVKDKTCPICVEEAGSRVAHWRKKRDPQPGVMHLDLAALRTLCRRAQVLPRSSGHSRD